MPEHILTIPALITANLALVGVAYRDTLRRIQVIEKKEAACPINGVQIKLAEMHNDLKWIKKKLDV
jgi:hypothetical protein